MIMDKIKKVKAIGWSDVNRAVLELNKAYKQLSKDMGNSAQEFQNASTNIRIALEDYRRSVRVQEAKKLHTRGHFLRNLITEYKFELRDSK